MNAWEAVQELVNSSEALRKASGHHAASMARLLAGNLRRVNDSTVLAQIKKELDAFDSRTGNWRRP